MVIEKSKVNDLQGKCEFVNEDGLVIILLKKPFALFEDANYWM